MTLILVGIGSNIEREKHIRCAVRELRAFDPNCGFSPVFAAEPVGFDGPTFYNLVAKLNTTWSLEQVLRKLKQIEQSYLVDDNLLHLSAPCAQSGELTAVKKSRNRTLDLDLLTYGERVQKMNPTLPRPDIYQFAFTLWPLAILCPDMKIPGDDQTFAQAWQGFTHQQVLSPVPSYLFNINS